MKTNVLINKKTVLYLLFSVLMVCGMQAQNCAPAPVGLTGGTEFNLVDSELDWWELGNIEYIGPPGGAVLTTLAYNYNLGAGGSGYRIVDNPSTVNPAWPNIDERMMVMSGMTANQSLLSYRVSGLKSGSTARIRITGYILSPSSCNMNLTFRPLINGNAAGTTGTEAPMAAPTGFQQQFVREATVTVPNTADGFLFDLRTSYTGPTSCIVLAISKIEVLGCLNIKVSSLEGELVCHGELIRLWPDREYNAATYKWEKSTNNGSTWTVFGGNVRSAVDPEITTPTQYRVTVDGTLSEVLRVSTKICCEISPGVGTSRRTIFHETFGTFQGPTTYTDAWGFRAERNLNPPYDVRAWNVNMPPGIIQNHAAVYVCPSDGQYIVSIADPNYLTACAGWAMQNYRADASGDQFGGVLAINIGSAAPIYQKRIDGLCPDVDLDFETSVADGSTVGGIDFEIRIEKTDGTLLGIKRARSTGATADEVALSRTNWHKITIPSIRTNETSVVLKVLSRIGAANGNDVIIDDIIFRICVPPIVELYSNLASYEQDATICDRYNVNLATQISELVKKYYDNAPRLLYQVSTNGGTTWSNISGITESETLVHAMSNYSSMAGSTVLFRIVVGTEGLLNDFEENPNSQGDTHCKTVSVSDPIKILVDCPCPTPRRVNVSNPKISNRVLAMCDEETVTLSISPALNENCDAYWFETNTIPAAGATPMHHGTTLNITASGIGSKTYYVRVFEKGYHESQSCWRYDYVTIKVDPAPATNILTDVCIPEERKNAPIASDNICFRFTSNYANGVLNGGDPYESRYRPFRELTGGTAIGPEIVVPANAVNSGDICFAGNQVSVTLATAESEPLYHIYLEDVTIVTKEGVLMDSEDLPTASSNGQQSASNIVNTRMLLNVTQTVTLKSVVIYLSGSGNINVTPVIYPSTGASDTPGTGINLTPVTAVTLAAGKRAFTINLNNRELTPGRYFLGFTFSATPTTIYYDTSPVNTYLFRTPFEDNLAQGGLALYGVGAKQATNNTDRYIISDLKFITQTAADNCDRVKLTNRYLCPLCSRPDEDAITRKRVDITFPADTKMEVDTIILCNSESVGLTVKPLRIDNAAATNEFDIIWYKGNQSTVLQTVPGAPTHTLTVPASELIAGNTEVYYVKIQDRLAPTDDGCWVWDSIYVRVNPTPIITVNPNPAAICKGLSTTLTASGATTYTWSPATGLSATTGATVTANPTATTPYTVTGSDANGCQGTTTATVTVNELPTITVNDAAVCDGLSATLTASGAISYTWSPSDGLSATTGATVTANPTGTTTYTVEGTDGNGCKNTATATVSISGLPTITVNSPAICKGESATLTAGGATTYTWTPSTGLSATTGATVTANPTGTTTYTVEGTDGNGCKNTATATVTVNELPTPAITKNPNETVITCTLSEIELTATGGTSYSWSNGANTATTRVSTAGTYEVTVTDGNSCTAKTSVVITEDKTLPGATIQNPSGNTQLTCTVKNISLTATGNGTYSWTDQSGNVVGTGATFVATTSDVYTVTVTGANGCTSTASITITQSDDMPKVSIASGTTVLTCTTPSINLTTTTTGGDGNYSYSWSNGASTADITVTTPATYTITVTDGNGCEGTASIPITENKTLPTVGITNNTGETVLTCTRLNISLTATGGVTYAWSGGLGNNANVTVDAQGTYTVTATAANGCTNTASISITENKNLPTINITNNTAKTELTCTTPSISLTATGGISYSWSGGLGSNANATVTTSGTYTVTGTAANGCTNTASITITEDKVKPTVNIANATGTTILTCTTTSISLTASGGVSYSWDGGLGSNASATVTAQGTYTVTATAANGCTNTASITITENKVKPTAGITRNPSTNVLTCAVQSISLTATGNGTYSWNNGLGNNATITVTTPGTYVVTVTGSNGCPDEASVTITENTNKPVVSIANNTGTTVLTCTTTSISLTASGGVNYSWNGGLGNSADATVTTPGTYTVTVTDDKGCTNTASTTITESKDLPDIIVNDDEICLGGAVTLTVRGADSYTWTTGETGSSITVAPTATATYTVEGTVTATGCKNTATAAVYVESPIGLTLEAPKSVNLGEPLTITITAERPDHGYFEWFLNNQPYQTVSDYRLTHPQPPAGRQHFLVQTATAKLGCSSSSEIYVEVVESVPNVINPYNPTGGNCCFMPGYRVEIYNRYMQKVFEGSDGWDGTYRGAVADPGTYFYRLFKQSGQVEKGTLEVVKF